MCNYNKPLFSIGVTISFFLLFLLCGCNKFLSEKNSIGLAVPTTISDFQAILDLSLLVNDQTTGVGIVGGDEYYVPVLDFNSLVEVNRNIYTWEGDDWFKDYNNGWTNSYDNVYRANSVLEGCGKIARTSENALDWDNLKGQAMFLRGRSFFDVASGWALAYDSKKAVNTMGIPLRLTTNFNTPSVRANLEDTYKRIISDLKNAIPLLPIKSVHVVRASKPAALGELARVYLSMRMYDSCFVYVDKALSYFNTLMDFNDLDTSKAFPISRFGPEVLYQTQLTPGFSAQKVVDSNIVKLFAVNDLRKAVFFTKTSEHTYSFQSYSGAFGIFGGIAGDELYLMRAECLARMGKTELALGDLNYLLSKRYIAGTFIPYHLNDGKSVLKLILEERKKELLFRGQRFMDIKRLNMEGYNISITRVVGDKTFVLKPNDPKFAMQIPKSVIDNSTLEQNPR